MFAENVYSVCVRLERFYSPRRHKPDFNTERNGSLKGKKNSGRFARVYGGSYADDCAANGRKPVIFHDYVRNYYISNSIFLHWRPLATDMILGSWPFR